LHLATSKALRDFSLHVAREIVEKDHLGKLVYAGGDDVLAFVNLKDLPEVMRKLRAYFSGSLTIDESTNRVNIDFKEGKGFIPIDDSGKPINIGRGKSKKGFMLTMGTKATASMGVVITHHNSNLSRVLDEVRKCEKEAKKLKDKNAIGIALVKRSGGTEYIQAKWYYDDGAFESIPLLRQWADTFYHNYISPKFVYTFITEAKGLEGLPKKVVNFELLRIADRQRNKSTREFNKDMMVKLVEGLIKLHNFGHSLDDIGRFLSLAVFLGKEDNR
jgi:CRISPR-associated protein Cmr2